VDLNHYRFVSVWRLTSSPDEVYRVLEDVDRYPLWWPEVRRTDRVDESTVKIVVRSFLPYELSFLASAARQDPQAGVLETAMRGDLDGFSRWTILAEASGTRAIFEEEVVARKQLLRWLAPIARPFFQLNHAAMMRHGQRRLPVYLAGYEAGLAQERGATAPSVVRDGSVAG
jgi:hypothetical protein